MSYQPGKLGGAAGISLIMAITFPYVFLTIPAQVLQNAAGLAWLSPLFEGIPVLLMLWGMIVVQNWAGTDLYGLWEYLCSRVGAWIIGVYYTGLFFINTIVLLRQFAENTLLTALPRMEFGTVVMVYIAVVVLLVHLGLEGMLRANYVILPFGIGGLIVLLLLLLPFYNIYELAPWQGNGLGAAIFNSIKFAGVGTGAFALVILASSFQDSATLKYAAYWGIGLGTGLKTVMVFCFVLAFGPAVGSEKVLPFFEMARLVYLSRYVQRIEALFIVLWVVVGLLAIAINLYVGVYLITRLLKLPTMRPVTPVVAVILAELAMIPPNVGSIVRFVGVIISTYSNIGLYAIPGLLLLLALLKKKRRRSGHG